MNYRLLDAKEWDLVRAEFEKRDWHLPDPQVAMIAVAEDEQGIRGFAVLQLAMHLEPVWAEEGATVNLRSLFRLLEKQFLKNSMFRGYITIAQESHIPALEAFGMEPLKGIPMAKVVKPQAV